MLAMQEPFGTVGTGILRRACKDGRRQSDFVVGASDGIARAIPPLRHQSKPLAKIRSGGALKLPRML